jgi:hypothetical protein
MGKHKDVACKKEAGDKERMDATAFIQQSKEPSP